jgi:hypothetical protein
MKRTLAVSLYVGIVFVAGTSLGTYLDPISPKVAEPIKTDFCFLVQNHRLFDGRTFTSSAQVLKGIEGAGLISPACDTSVALFKLPSSPSPELATIQSHLSSFDPTVVTITFEGKTRLSLREKLRRHFSPAPAGETAIIDIHRLISVDVRDDNH